MYSSSDFYLTDWLVLRGTRGRLKGVFPGYKERGVSGVQGKGCFRGTRKGVFPGYKERGVSGVQGGGLIARFHAF